MAFECRSSEDSNDSEVRRSERCELQVPLYSKTRIDGSILRWRSVEESPSSSKVRGNIRNDRKRGKLISEATDKGARNITRYYRRETVPVGVRRTILLLGKCQEG